MGRLVVVGTQPRRLAACADLARWPHRRATAGSIRTRPRAGARRRGRPRGSPGGPGRVGGGGDRPGLPLRPVAPRDPADGLSWHSSPWPRSAGFPWWSIPGRPSRTRWTSLDTCAGPEGCHPLLHVRAGGGGGVPGPRACTCPSRASSRFPRRPLIREAALLDALGTAPGGDRRALPGTRALPGEAMRALARGGGGAIRGRTEGARRGGGRRNHQCECRPAVWMGKETGAGSGEQGAGENADRVCTSCVPAPHSPLPAPGFWECARQGASPFPIRERKMDGRNGGGFQPSIVYSAENLERAAEYRPI